MKVTNISENWDDLRIISEWYFGEWGHLDAASSIDRIFEGLSSKLKKNDNFLSIISVYENQNLVAVADLKYREHKDYPAYEHWIGGVFVKPEYRRKGYAAALIEKSKEHVAQLRIPELYLQCEEHNEGLYLKHGFKPLHSALHYGVKTTIFKFTTSPRNCLQSDS